MGKGSKPRPYDGKVYRERWDEIDWKKEEKPKKPEKKIESITPTLKT